MPLRSTLVGIALLAATVALKAGAADGPSLDRRFEEVVAPFLKDNCLACHGPKKQEGKLDLGGYSSADAVVKGLRTWDLVLERLEAEEMPPEKAPRQPTAAERRTVIEWIGALRDREARKNAGDPGPVLARRLSNAEFDHTVRDLTGVDLRPAREFPVDPANEAGFDNSGESLTMSPALVEKYLAASREVAEHLVLQQDGLEFAPDPAVTDTDRDKYCVRRIIDFYERHKVEYADYFLVAWKYQRREALGKPSATLGDFAREAHLSPRYLETIWATLNAKWPESGPLGELQALWRELPTDVKATEEARRGCERMRVRVVRLRKEFEPTVRKLKAPGISAGSQPFVLWQNRKRAEQRMKSPGKDRPRDREEFCRVFPDTFFVSDRAPYFDPKGGKSGRLLTAGFHLMQGYFRDDAPLSELVLDEAGRQELDGLWRELDFVTLVPNRQYKDFIFFERAEPPQFAGGPDFDFARSEDKDATSEAKMARLRDAYLAKARKLGAEEEALNAIETYFTEMSARIRRVEQDRRDAEPRHVEALLKLAARAYRRPLKPAEREQLRASYRDLRQTDGLGHEDTIRDMVAGLLMSPQFLFRSDPAGPGEAPSPLSDHALAGRLSYFLWSSLPDDELLSHAGAGDLHEPRVIAEQVRRMLRDVRARGLATEFAGNWLDVRRFDEHNGVDRGRFPSFTNELRRAMAEEPIRFFLDVAGNDRSILEFVNADHTFVNPVLARHYGMPALDVKADEWVRVDDARRFGRGGLLPMSAFLTANSPGLRTSPVKRGYWVVRRMLGEQIPAPPPGCSPGVRACDPGST